MLHDIQDWVRHYRPSSKSIWQGRSGKYFHEIIILDDLRQPIEPNPNGMNFGIIGFSSDEGVIRNHGRPGASDGPSAFREAFGKLPVHAPPSWKFFDMGDIVCDDGDLESAQMALAQTVEEMIKQHIFPIVIGGGHEVSWGTFQGISNADPEKVLSIINFDSHFDLRPLEGEKGTSGTSFLQMAKRCSEQNKPFFYTCFGIQELGNSLSLFDQAKNLGVRYKTASEIMRENNQEIDPFINTAIDTADGVFLTICLDVLSSCYAPGVSAPQPLGLDPHKILPFIKKIARSGRVVGLDLAELCPAHDRDRQTAFLAAYLVSNFIHEITSDHYPRGPWSACE